MRQHWGEATNLLSILAYLIKNTNHDGLEMKYTIPLAKPIIAKDTTELVKSLERTVPRGTSNINSALESIFDDYAARLKQSSKARSRPGNMWSFKSRKAVLPLSLYVLTDGQWEKRYDPQRPIIRLLQRVFKKSPLAGKQVSIQFISFGGGPSDLDLIMSRGMDGAEPSSEPIVV
jgi:hypothetical protein